MRTYRVYLCEFSFPRGNGKVPDFGADGPDRDYLTEILSHSLGKMKVQARPRPDGSLPPNKSTITVEDVVLATEIDTLHLRCGIGKSGAHDYARALTEADISLVNRSAESSHYATWLFPQSSSHRTVVVVEAEGTRDLRTRLTWLISHSSAKIRSEYTGPRKERPLKMVADFTLIADPDYTEEMIRNADAIGARFSTKVASARGSEDLDVENRKLELRLSDDDKNKNWLISLIRKWKSQNSTKREALRDLNMLLYNDEAGVYDEASFSVKDGKRSIPLSIEEILEQAFSYTLSDSHPSETTWFKRIREKSNALASRANTDCALSDLDEIEETLSQIRGQQDVAAASNDR